MSRKFSVLLVLLMLLMVTSVPALAASVNIPLATYFARVQPNPVYQLVNEAAVAFGKEHLKGTQYEGLPVISRASVTKAGFKGAADFANVPAGELAPEGLAMIYPYKNTIQALKINGKQIIEWLEKSAGNFNQIDPNATADQLLINYGFDSHLLDHFWGITYQFDVTQPLGHRVVNAKFNGEPLSENMQFIVMTDNYRAGGGGAMPNAVPQNIVMKWDDDFKAVVADYLTKVGGKLPTLVINWSIKPVETKGKVILKTGNEWGTPVMDYMQKAAEFNTEPVDHFNYVGTDDVWGLFTIDLAKVKTR